MSEQTTTIISKVWGMCGPLRDDGVSYGDYLEQLTYLIFLKMSDEYAKPPYKRETGIPTGCNWADMSDLKGVELEEKYKSILKTLGEQGGTLGKIFKGATNKINNAAILYRIVQMIDKEKWVSMSTDVKGEIYEGLLQKNAEDVKSGAGQYFTPRPLIQAMVKCIRPEPMKTVADPCCGSGGFLLAAQSYLTDPQYYNLDREAKEFLKKEAFRGWEIVPATFKMSLMNLYLHNIGDLYGPLPWGMPCSPILANGLTMCSPIRPLVKSPLSPSQTRRESRKERIWSTTGRTSGPPAPTNSSTFSSTSTPC